MYSARMLPVATRCRTVSMPLSIHSASFCTANIRVGSRKAANSARKKRSAGRTKYAGETENCPVESIRTNRRGNVMRKGGKQQNTAERTRRHRRDRQNPNVFS